MLALFNQKAFSLVEMKENGVGVCTSCLWPSERRLAAAAAYKYGESKGLKKKRTDPLKSPKLLKETLCSLRET